jgi:hypothetical protein
MACGFLSVASATAATSAPEVRLEAVSEVSSTGATARAWINAEGGETSYEIWLECREVWESGGQCEPLTTDPQRRQGTLPGVSEALLVSDAFTGLQPGYLYKYRVVATNSAGRSGFFGAGFEPVICQPMSLCPGQPYAPGEPLWILEGAERAGQEAPRLEAEREAKHREEQERPAKEAAERAAKEREIREAGERTGKEQAQRAASAGPLRLVKRAEEIEAELAQRPGDERLLASLTRTRINAANTMAAHGVGDSKSGTEELKQQFALAGVAWSEYLKVTKKPGVGLAILVAPAFFALAELSSNSQEALKNVKAADAVQKIVVKGRPGKNSLSTLAFYDLFAQRYDAADESLEKAIAYMNTKSERETLEKKFEEVEKNARQFGRRLKAR